MSPSRSASRKLAPSLFMLGLTGLIGLTVLIGGCGGNKTDDAEAVAEANKVWQERCVTCHGDGSGNGPGAAALAVKPRSFKDPTWQASVDNERIKKVMVEGGASVGLNEAMAPNPDLKDKPAVQDQLVKKIRSLAQ